MQENTVKKVGILRCQQTEDWRRDEMRNAIARKVGEEVGIIDYTH